METDPLERLKFVMTANFSWLTHNHMFAKPLNPILGETYQAFVVDGTKLFVEQTSHHPPRSHFIADGPNDSFSMQGWLEYAIFAGLQSSNVNCLGYKQANFPDGTKIVWNYNNDYFTGLFMGTMNHKCTGQVNFSDQKNGLKGFYRYGAYTFSKQDYVWGEIFKDDKKVCEIEGNYMGYLDFDKKRYWDFREGDKINFPEPFEDPNSLPSQSSKRLDGRVFLSRPVEEAQAEKERLENLQRHDRKLREEAAERRKNGGPKFQYRKDKEAEAAAE